MSSSTRQQRILCLWFPDWPVQRLLHARPELRRVLLWLVERTTHGEFVAYGNARASKRGIQPGMSIAEARSLVHEQESVVTQPVQPVEDRQALGALALRCEPYSFCIGLEEGERPECLLLDVTGVAKFFAGEQGLAEQLSQELTQQKFDVQIATADTVSAAWAAAHWLARPRQPLVIPAGELQRFESLPVAALRLEAAALAKLQRLGIKRIGQLLALNRASLSTRLGLGVLRRIDQLTGAVAELIVPYQPLPQFQVQRSLEDGITSTAAIEHLWSTLLEQLVAQLTIKRLGTRRVQCLFRLENRTQHEFNVRMCEAVADAKHIGDLLRLKLERFRLPAPLVGLQMEACEVAAQELPQREFLASDAPKQSRPFSMLLNRLSSRLGKQAVVRAALVASPIPERAAEWVPVTDGAAVSFTKFAETLKPLDRPLGLFAEPRVIEVLAVLPDGPPTVVFWQGQQFEIARHRGPERIESGWWQDSFVRRDYYQVETRDGRRLWLFRRHQDARWFWHGEVL